MEVTWLVVPVTGPSTVPSLFTMTMTVQLACGVSDTPVKLIRLPPDAAVAPPHVPANPFGVAIINPAGKVSENASACKVTTWFGLLRVKVRLELPPDGML